jgi:hypothetical protein
MNTRLFFTALLLSVFLTSCNFKETIVFNPDGTGEMGIAMDGAGLMEKAGTGMAKETEKRIDTTFSFKKLLAEKKDSIATLPPEQQEAYKSLERYDMSLLVDSEKKLMLISMKTKFKNVGEVADIMKSMNKLASLKGKKPMDLADEKVSTRYAFDGTLFKRIVNNQALTAKEKEGVDQLTEGYKDIFGGSTYTMEYVFPRKIISVSDKQAKISNNGKTVTITRNFLDYMRHPESLSVDVKLSAK